MTSSRTSSVGPNLSLFKLRFLFIVLGAVLLATLAIVTSLAGRRLDEARHEREEMVASRVFDEMEREVSAFLDLENERPHYSKLAETNPETWAPFVVGYFSEQLPLGSSSTEVAVAEGATSEHHRRLSWAIGKARSDWTATVSDESSRRRSFENEQGEEPSKKEDLPPLLEQKSQSTAGPGQLSEGARGAAPPAPAKPATDREIIESLNRAPERRKSKTKASSPKEADDPFTDYSLSF